MSQEFVDFTKKRFATEAPEVPLIDITMRDDRERTGTYYTIHVDFESGQKQASIFIPDGADMTKSVNLNMYSQAIIIETKRAMENSND